MRKLIVLTFITLDGVMQSPGGPEEDTSGGFHFGGWSAGYWDSFMDTLMIEQMGHPFDLLLGRKTYEIFSAYWPTSKERGAEALNHAKKYVVSKTMTKLDWENSVRISTNVVAEIETLKQQDGPELQVHGSSALIQTLLRHDLIDEFWLKTFPITLGTGKRLFGDGTMPAAYKVTKSQTSPKGVVITTYVRNGAIKTGSFV